MSLVQALRRLHEQGVHVWVNEGTLRFRAPSTGLLPEQREFLTARKAEILAALTAGAQHSATVYPLTEIQSAYLMGRDENYQYGSVGCHVYMEMEYPPLAADRVRRSWQQLVERHEMLRTVIRSDGFQELLATVPDVHVQVSEGTDRQGPGIQAVRERLSTNKYPVDSWPFFTVELTQLPGMSVLHLDVDFMIADWASIWLLLKEFGDLMEGRALAPLPLTFGRYLELEAESRHTVEYDRDRNYWLARVSELPGAPHLPLLAPSADQKRFDRLHLELSDTQWCSLEQRCQQWQLTPTALLGTLYATVLSRWSENGHFCLNLTLLNRLPLHPGVQQVVGDFTSVSPLEVDLRAGDSLKEAALQVQRQMFDDLDHRRFPGVGVLREMARQKGSDNAFLPYVFTSAVGLPGVGEQPAHIGEYGRSETPQVFIDCQAMDGPHGLRVNWDVRRGVFPPGMVEDLFAIFRTELLHLAGPESLAQKRFSERTAPQLPEWQQRDRARVNGTAADIAPAPMHAAWLEQLQWCGAEVALIELSRTWTHDQLFCRAREYAQILQGHGVGTGDLVALVGEKRGELVAAVLGILLAGAAYLPVDHEQPARRRDAMIEESRVRMVLADAELTEPLAVSAPLLTMDLSLPVPHSPAWQPAAVAPTDVAYVIHTSGSTGQPKGVVITHGAAWNTIADVIRRFGVVGRDRVLSLSRMNFDLSVFDLFGVLGVGGAVVLPDPQGRLDPRSWGELVVNHRVTVWNTVPALLDLLVGEMEREGRTDLPLRCVLLSGDWVPTTLPGRLQRCAPGAEVVALGGATEASIWSNYHRCQAGDEQLPNIPYGMPLANQTLAVVDDAGDDCPVWVSGDLLIGGRGLAKEYLHDPSRTTASFVELGGQRMYRTGDRGRYLPSGEIEFLGRRDSQVKLRGYRIELGEIEAAMMSLPGVAQAAVCLCDVGGEQHLLGLVCPRPSPPNEPAPVLQFSTAADVVDHLGGRGIASAQSATAVLALGGGGDDRAVALARALAVPAPRGPGVVRWWVSGDPGVAITAKPLDLGNDLRAQGIVPGSFSLLVHSGAGISATALVGQGGTEVRVTDQGYELREAQDQVRPDQILDGLSALLPRYMVPSQVQVVEELPLTDNQKVDRRRMAGWFVVSGTDGDVDQSQARDAVEFAAVEVVELALGRRGLAAHASFYDYGADSLVLAQVAGRLRDLLQEQHPSATISFDAILRGLLDEPTLRQTVLLLRKLREQARREFSGTVPTDEQSSAPETEGIGRLHQLGGIDSGIARVVPHAGLGTMNAFRFLNAHLVAQDAGLVVGLTVGDVPRYCQVPAADLVATLGREYAQHVIDAGYRRVQLIGYCMGGFIALEMARTLAERGVDIVDFTLVDSAPLLYDIDNTMVLELIFITNFYISINQVYPEMDNDLLMASIQSSFHAAGQRLTGAEVGKMMAGEDPAAAMLRALDAKGQEQRFSDYTATVERITGQVIPPDMLIGYYRMYVHSFLASAINPEPYFGDITYLQASEPMDFLFADALDTVKFWREVCVGELRVDEVQGNHITCVEIDAHAADVADRLLQALPVPATEAR